MKALTTWQLVHHLMMGENQRCDLHVIFVVETLLPSTTTTSGGRGIKSNCDSNGFGNNNSLRVYRVMLMHMMFKYTPHAVPSQLKLQFQCDK